MFDMRTKTVARLILAALVLALAPVQAEAGGGRLEGYLLGVDGRAASDHRVHLIDGDGLGVAQTSTSDDGVYRFRDLKAGEYSLGIESPDGQMAPVAAPPVRLGTDELARRDIKLIASGQAERDAVGRENYSFGVWWAGLSPAAKAGSIIGTFVILGVTVKALDDDEEGGTPVGSD
jgi:hypothetical protein